MRTKDQIEDQIDATGDAGVGGTSQWPGMPYEQGVYNALMWVLEQSDDAPMDG